jgi:hypothetical protein
MVGGAHPTSTPASPGACRRSSALRGVACGKAPSPPGAGLMNPHMSRAEQRAEYRWRVFQVFSAAFSMTAVPFLPGPTARSRPIEGPLHRPAGLDHRKCGRAANRHPFFRAISHPACSHPSRRSAHAGDGGSVRPPFGRPPHRARRTSQTADGGPAGPCGCSRKNRTNSRDASGPAGSVYEPWLLPPDQAWPAPWTVHCSTRT